MTRLLQVDCRWILVEGELAVKLLPHEIAVWDLNWSRWWMRDRNWAFALHQRLFLRKDYLIIFQCYFFNLRILKHLLLLALWLLGCKDRLFKQWCNGFARTCRTVELNMFALFVCRLTLPLTQKLVDSTRRWQAALEHCLFIWTFRLSKRWYLLILQRAVLLRRIFWIFF